MNDYSSGDRRTVVLLGASNLTIGWRDVMAALTAGHDMPTDVFAALGMGRSYVDWSRFALRELPGIRDCGLFHDLSRTLTQQAEASQIPLVMITDIGNDLVYGRTPEVVAGAVQECLQKIVGCAPQVNVLLTGLPVNSVERLSRLRFLIARSLLFPGCRQPLSVILQQSRELDLMVRQIAADWNAVFVEPDSDWYGIDPIHIRRSVRPAAFRHLFSNWPGFTSRIPSESFPAIRPQLPEAARKRVRGRLQESVQPRFVSQRLRVFSY